jgi:hypothetical protein
MTTLLSLDCINYLNEPYYQSYLSPESSIFSSLTCKLFLLPTEFHRRYLSCF